MRRVSVRRRSCSVTDAWVTRLNGGDHRACALVVNGGFALLMMVSLSRLRRRHGTPLVRAREHTLDELEILIVMLQEFKGLALAMV